MNNELKELFLKSKNFSFKLENYFDAYHENFNGFRNKEITFVEIGIFQGGSLEIWKKYFGNKARIIGIDINPECKKFEDDQIEIFIGDQSDPNFWKNFFQKVGDVDVILDDGSHTNYGQITTTIECIKNIKDGGILFIEDVHTSYLKKYNSSQKLSFINFAKKIIDDINLNDSSEPNNKYNYSLNKEIYSANFYSGCVVFKVDRTKTIKNDLVSNEGIKHGINDLTWVTNPINKKNKIFPKLKFFNNINRILNKIKINKYLKKFFS